jgi:hypothetical protein
MGLNKFLPSDFIQKGAFIWTHWNGKFAPKAHLVYRVEELRKGTETMQQICTLLGLDPESIVDANTDWDDPRYALQIQPDRLINIDAGLHLKMMNLAQSYGYEL